IANSEHAKIEGTIHWENGQRTDTVWLNTNQHTRTHCTADGNGLGQAESAKLHERLNGIRTYSLDPVVIAQPVQLQPNAILQSNGAHFASVLERVRDDEPERFEAFNADLGRWLPEF